MPVLSRALMLTAAALLTACATAQENPHYKYSTKYKGAAPSTGYASNTAASSAGTTVQHASTYSSHTATSGTVQTAAYSQTSAAAPLSYTQNAPQLGTTRAITTHNVPTYSSSSHSATTHTAAYQPPVAQAANTAPPIYSRISAACVASNQQGTLNCTPQSISIGKQTAQISQPYQNMQITGAGSILASNTPANAPAAVNAVSNNYVTAQYSASTASAQPPAAETYGTPGYEAMKNVETEWSYEDVAPAQPAAATPKPYSAPAVLSARTHDMQPAPQETFALGSSHVVKQGDTVYSFSRRLCSSIEDIKQINGLDAKFGLQIGQTIRLPASRC